MGGIQEAYPLQDLELEIAKVAIAIGCYFRRFDFVVHGLNDRARGSVLEVVPKLG
jgi:hypothetical protein